MAFDWIIITILRNTSVPQTQFGECWAVDLCLEVTNIHGIVNPFDYMRLFTDKRQTRMELCKGTPPVPGQAGYYIEFIKHIIDSQNFYIRRTDII